MPATRRPILVAVSGGPDSTSLLIWLQEQQIPVEVAHFDHDLRPGSASDALTVGRLCRELGIRAHLGRRSSPLPSGSRQSAARQLRYQFLEHARQAAGADIVAMGHTADDVIEGAVLHLLRGAGMAGLRGMPERRGPYVRPFLNVWKSEIEAFLMSRGVGSLSDPSNLDRAFGRVRVRLDLLPSLERESPGFKYTLHRVARLASLVQAGIEIDAAALAGHSAAALRAAPVPVRMERYRQMYVEAGGALPGLGRRHLGAIDRLTLTGRTGASANLPSDLVFRVMPDSVGITGHVCPERPILKIRTCTGCDDADAGHLDPQLVAIEDLRAGVRTPGLRLRPNRNSGTRKLQDLLTDARVPRHQRDDLPLVFAGERLAWVPGVAAEHSLQAKPGQPALHLSFASGTPVTGKGQKGTDAKIQEPISR